MDYLTLTDWHCRLSKLSFEVFYPIEFLFQCRTHSYDAHSLVKSPYLLSYPLAALPLFTVYTLIRWLIHVLCFLAMSPLLQGHSRAEHSFTDSESMAGLITAGIAPTDGWRQLREMWMLFTLKKLVWNLSLSVLGAKIRHYHITYLIDSTGYWQDLRSDSSLAFAQVYYNYNYYIY